MLSSDDPAVLQQGAQLIARNGQLFNRLRAMDGFGSKAGAVAATRNVASRLQTPLLQHGSTDKKTNTADATP
jgi:hypothetical protein